MSSHTLSPAHIQLPGVACLAVGTLGITDTGMWVTQLMVGGLRARANNEAPFHYDLLAYRGLNSVWHLFVSLKIPLCFVAQCHTIHRTLAEQFKYALVWVS